MGRYRGAGKARGMDDGLFTSDLPFQEINPRLRTAEKFSEAFLRKEYTRQRDIAQKRLKRMEKAGVGDWVLEQHPNGFPKLKELPDRDALVYALMKVSRFLAAERSSVSGIKRVAAETAASLTEQTERVITPSQLSNFGHFLNSMKKFMGIKEGTYDVKYVAEVWSDLKNKGKITKKQLNEALEAYMTDRETAGKKKKKDLSEARQAELRKIAERITNDIDKYFDAVDLEGRTLAGLRKRKKK